MLTYDLLLDAFDKPMDNKELTLQLKLNHANFLSIPETRGLIYNLEKKLEKEVSYILTHSVLDKLSDAQIRNLCAKAQATREMIDYVCKEPSSIVRSRE